jgi:hypothetical protein
MPVDVRTKEDGSKETTFEFTSNSSAIHSSPLSSTSSPIDMSPIEESKRGEDDAADDHGIELKIQSV